jgi:hypothetical protein
VYANRLCDRIVGTFAAALWRHDPRMIDRAQELRIPWPTLKATDLVGSFPPSLGLLERTESTRRFGADTVI